MCSVPLIQQHSVRPKSCPKSLTWLSLWARSLKTSITEILAWTICLKSNTEFLGSFSMFGLSQVVGTEASSNLITYDVFACFAKTAVIQVVVFQRFELQWWGTLIGRKGLRPKVWGEHVIHWTYGFLSSVRVQSPLCVLGLNQFLPWDGITDAQASSCRPFSFFCAPSVFQKMPQRTGAPPVEEPALHPITTYPLWAKCARAEQAERLITPQG